MRVELTIEGGVAHFPGLARPLVVQASRLPDEAAAQLRELCASAIVEARRRAAGAPAEPGQDARTYRLTIADGRGTRKIVCADPIGQGPLSELVDFVRAHGARGAG